MTANLPEPYHADKLATLYHGDCLDLLRLLPEASIDATITDPPYSSGGAFRSDRQGAPEEKYQLKGWGAKDYATFSGDNKDQRAYEYWSTLWISQVFRITKPGGVLAVFSDWRQLPTTTDALQAGGFVWRGIAVWDKTTARPAVGRYAQQTEFVAWGSKGSMHQTAGPSLRGLYSIRNPPDEKQHMTGKPTRLMRELCRIAWREDATILDPFAGSATTLRAAKDLGIRSIGVEYEKQLCEVAKERLKQPAKKEGRGKPRPRPKTRRKA